MINPARSERHDFDSNEKGTEESLWHEPLSCLPIWNPEPAAQLVIVAPHPDDEILGAGGLIATYATTHKITVISVTDGEASHSGWQDLASVRRAELDRALNVLTGRSVVVERLGLPDGAVRSYTDKLRAVMFGQANASERVIMLAPFEHDGHPDHDVVGAVAIEVGKVTQAQVIRYPVWTWHHARPDTVLTDHWRRFDMSEHARRAKQRALQCFDSQLTRHHGTTIIGPHVRKYFERPFETFIV